MLLNLIVVMIGPLGGTMIEIYRMPLAICITDSQDQKCEELITVLMFAALCTS